MRDALNQTGRPIFYSACEWGELLPALWFSSVANSWRTTGDISDHWLSMLFNIDINDLFASFAAPHGKQEDIVFVSNIDPFFIGFNDPDMLEVGNGGMTLNEYRSHMSLWSIAKSPLLIGCDVRTISQESLELLTNSEVIAINQDSLGKQGTKLRIDLVNETEVWGGPLADGSQAVLAFNRDNNVSRTILVLFSDLGWKITSRVKVRDLWLHKDLGEFEGNYTAYDVESHGVQMLKMTLITL
jgi:alpha-galactosidase